MAMPPSASVCFSLRHTFSLVLHLCPSGPAQFFGLPGSLVFEWELFLVTISSLPHWYWSHSVKAWELGLRKFCRELPSGNSGSKGSWMNLCHPQLYNIIIYVFAYIFSLENLKLCERNNIAAIIVELASSSATWLHYAGIQWWPQEYGDVLGCLSINVALDWYSYLSLL